jgi:hypothetical protein
MPVRVACLVTSWSYTDALIGIPLALRRLLGLGWFVGSGGAGVSGRIYPPMASFGVLKLFAGTGAKRERRIAGGVAVVLFCQHDFEHLAFRSKNPMHLFRLRRIKKPGNGAGFEDMDFVFAAKDWDALRLGDHYSASR